MTKKLSSTRQPFWWETRTWGLRVLHEKTGSVVAAIRPSILNDVDWVLFIEDGEPEYFCTPTLARLRAEKILGDKVKWYFYRCGGEGRGKQHP